ncbi:MAG: hypothetical protein OJF59_000248 [Cytophagales bacterium]|jgi:apolipoprotein N-acyltransferase|nr:hypothetical protein [Bacteroidota bacterium]MBS1981251.1 hypothetical protein [Bacteroidota bacterium]WHZ06495.1 MAG: hypothetical protein OJF59_000248 [Cytophagales bacterium]
MKEEIIKAIPVFFSSALKFILGPISGYALRLHFVTTALSTIGGMMLSVVSFTYFGDWLRNKFFKRFFEKKESEPQKKWYSNFLKRYGLVGIALLTPIILTPIGGTILAVSLGKSKDKILIAMLISAVLFALAFTSAIYALGKLDLPDVLK